MIFPKNFPISHLKAISFSKTSYFHQNFDFSSKFRIIANFRNYWFGRKFWKIWVIFWWKFKKIDNFVRKFWENNKKIVLEKLVRINGSIIIIVWPLRNLQIFMVFIWMWYSGKMLRKITKKIPKWYKYLSWRWPRDRSLPRYDGSHDITRTDHVVQFQNQKIVIGIRPSPLNSLKFGNSHLLSGHTTKRGRSRLNAVEGGLLVTVCIGHRWLSHTSNFGWAFKGVMIVLA